MVNSHALRIRYIDWMMIDTMIPIESVKNATAAASKHQKMTAKLEKSLEETKNELKESHVFAAIIKYAAQTLCSLTEMCRRKWNSCKRN